MKPFPKLKNPLILAPMEDVTSLAFRLLCRRYGASMAYTEQTSSIALSRGNETSESRINTNKEDRPVGLQLFGRNEKLLVDVAEKYGKNFDVIDLNFGCPSKNIVNQGYGSALLKEKEKIREIITYMVECLDKPVTVKMRSGFKKVEAVELVKVMENSGVSAITLHARTQEQGYSGKADWEIIKRVKETVSVPVIGNGDVRSGKDALRMLDITDYVMIGRAARDNPMIFKQILHYFNTLEELEFSREDRVQIFKDYSKLEHEVKLLKLRAVDWTKGLRDGATLRDRLQKAKTIEGIKELFNEISDPCLF